MQALQSTKQRNNLALPSPTEAGFYMLHAYYQKTISKIRIFLQQFCISLSKTPTKQKKKYSQLTNQQMTQRGYFLHYIYQCIVSLHQISKYSNILSKSTQNRNGPFKSFIHNLLFSLDDLAKITRIKRNNKTQVANYNLINKQIIQLLHQTEIYAYQMLIRIIQIKFIYEQEQKYRKEIEQLNQRYIFAEYFTNPKTLCSKKQKMTIKRFFSQMQSIFMYYHCQISINRTQCNSKPQLNCLLHLLKNRQSKPFLSYIQEHFNFRCEGQILLPYVIPQAKTIWEAPAIVKSQTEYKEPNLQLYLAEISKQIQSQQQQKSHLQQSINQKLSKKQSAQSHSSPSQIILTIKQENQQQIAIYASKKEEEINIVKKSKYKLVEKERKSFQASDDDYIESRVKHLKYQRADQPQDKHNQKYKQSKHSSKNLSLKEKMKVLGHNQRFAHTLCNIKYVVSSKSSKKDNRRSSRQQKDYKLSNKVSNTPIIHFNKQKDHSQESFLAQQTPIHRYQAYINKN